MAAVIAEEASVDFVCVMQYAVHETHCLQLSTFELFETGRAVNLLALLNVFSVSESCHLCVLLLHHQQLALTCLAVLNALIKCLQAGWGFKTSVLQTFTLRCQHVSPVCILVQSPICESKFVRGQEVFCLKVLNVLSH